MRIVLSGGASGGHAFPARALAEAITAREKNIEIFILLPEKLFFPWNPEALSGWEVYRVPGRGFHIKKPWTWPATLASFLASKKKAAEILSEIRPDAVVCFGTYLTAAIVSWTKKNNVPTIIHEQNVLLGRANKWSLRNVTGLALGMPELLEGEAALSNIPVRVCGQLLRSDLRKTAGDIPARHSKVCTLLIFGGSQGSGSVNEHTMNAIGRLGEDEKRKLHVLHLSGPRDLARVKAFYAEQKVAHGVLEYSNDMGALYRRADVVISRSGAGAMAEAALFKRALLLIPFPSLHQRKNAEYLASKKAAFVFDPTASREPLERILSRLIQDETLRESTGKRLGELIATDGTEKVCDWIFELTHARDQNETVSLTKSHVYEAAV